MADRLCWRHRGGAALTAALVAALAWIVAVVVRWPILNREILPRSLRHVKDEAVSDRIACLTLLWYNVLDIIASLHRESSLIRLRLFDGKELGKERAVHSESTPCLDRLCALLLRQSLAPVRTLPDYGR
jgi:hypothetical protein